MTLKNLYNRATNRNLYYRFIVANNIKRKGYFDDANFLYQKLVQNIEHDKLIKNPKLISHIYCEYSHCLFNTYIDTKKYAKPMALKSLEYCRDNTHAKKLLREINSEISEQSDPVLDYIDMQDFIYQFDLAKKLQKQGKLDDANIIYEKLVKQIEKKSDFTDGFIDKISTELISNVYCQYAHCLLYTSIDCEKYAKPMVLKALEYNKRNFKAKKLLREIQAELFDFPKGTIIEFID
jgi:hypothetical protein